MTEVIEKTVKTPETAERTTAVAVGLKPLVLSQRPLIRAYNGDCNDWMQATVEKAYDLAIVDPPYGHGEDIISNNKTRGVMAIAKDYGEGKWNKEPPPPEYFDKLRRVSKDQIIWGGNYFELHPTPCFIVWDKDNGDNSFSDCELAWTSFDTAVRKIKWRWNGMLQQNMAAKDKRIHPTQKPVALYRWLLKNYAKAGQRILDTHGGSFSSAVACFVEGFDLDICEIDAEYFEAGVKRFKQATKQMDLFNDRS